MAPAPLQHDERWHRLLTTRYVCDFCLTRFFAPYRVCPACHQPGRVHRLNELLYTVADNDQELRDMMARGGSPTRH